MDSNPRSRNPSLPRSLSDPHLARNRRHRHSSLSTTSSKSSWTSKLAKLLARLAIFSRDSDLTEESLKAHNKRITEMDEKAPKTSPYYRGLTDSSLAIDPSAATNSSLSSFISKLKDCIGKKKNSAPPAPTPAPALEESLRRPETVEKPLRERLLQSSRRGEVAEENERDRFTWGDRYRPEFLGDFVCNREKAVQLKNEVRERGCENYIFEGPPGVGKKTMVQAMLREVFGREAMEIKEVNKVFHLKSEMVGSIEVKMKESHRYVEVNLSQTKGYEKQVIVQLIKETHSPNLPCDRSTNCRGIMLCEADKLSNETLMYVRWVIERYKGCNKIIFCCSDISKLQPVKSLCHVIQLFPPSKHEIVEVLEFIAKQQGFDLSTRMAAKIADNSKNNLRQAIRSLEASWDKSQSFQEDENQLLTGWEDDIADVAKKIVEEQSPKQLYIVRGKLKKLIEHDVSPNFIFKTLVEELKKLLDEELQRRIECHYDDYNINEEKAFVSDKVYGEEGHDPMRKNVHHFMKIEEFIAKFMSCYKDETSRKTQEVPQ